MPPRPPRPKLVIVESPYKGDIERNMAYLEVAIYDSILRGEAPFASHKLYTSVLNDDDPEERRLGISLGSAWLQVADLVAFYIDFGMSEGMEHRHRELVSKIYRVPFELRRVTPDALDTIRNAGPTPAQPVRSTPII